MPTDQPTAAHAATHASAKAPLPDLVLLTADITILADGRHWKSGTVIKDPEVVALLFAAGGAGLEFFQEIGDV